VRGKPALNEDESGLVETREVAPTSTAGQPLSPAQPELAAKSRLPTALQEQVELPSQTTSERTEREQPLAEIPIKASLQESPGGGHYLRFDIHTSTIERETGFKFERGKVYRIEWDLEEVGRFTKEYRGNSDHFVFCTPVGVADGIDLMQRHKIEVLSIKETHEARIVDDGAHPRVLVAMSDLRGAGLRGAVPGDILRLSFTNSSNGQARMEAFATMTKWRVTISLTHLDVGVHDKLELSAASKYREGDFAFDFNKHLPPSMRNLRLSFEQRASLQVDKIVLNLNSTELQTYSSRVLLKSTVEAGQQSNTHLYLDGRHVSTSDCVLSLWYHALERQSRVTCRVGKHVFQPEQVTCPSEREAEPPKIDKKFLQGRAELTSKEGVEGRYRFRLDREAIEAINQRLRWAGEHRRYKYEKGGIAEDLCSSVLETAGWEEVRRHPLSNRLTYMASNEHGPDSLMRLTQNSRHSFHEMKWWQNLQTAWDEAKTQLDEVGNIRRLRDGTNIMGAYIDLLDMKPNSPNGVVHVKQAW
jgi:hypothetical protein